MSSNILISYHLSTSIQIENFLRPSGNTKFYDTKNYE